MAKEHDLFSKTIQWFTLTFHGSGVLCVGDLVKKVRQNDSESVTVNRSILRKPQLKHAQVLQRVFLVMILSLLLTTTLLTQHFTVLGSTTQTANSKLTKHHQYVQSICKVYKSQPQVQTVEGW